MKKKIGIVLLLLTLGCALVLAGCANNENPPANTDQPTNGEGTAEDQSLQKVLDKGELVIGLDDNYPPIGFRDENGDLTGFDVELATAACEHMGVKASFRPVEWDGVLLNLKNGDIDCIWNGMGITPEREAEIAFSRVYMEVDNILIIRNDSDIASKADLAGKIVATQLGSTADVAITSDPIYDELKELRKFGSYAEAFLDLQAGRVDAVVSDNVNGLYLMKQESLQDSLKVLEETDLIPEYWGVGLRKEDVALKNKIDEVLNEMKADGTSDAISQKWFNDTLIQ